MKITNAKFILGLIVVVGVLVAMAFWGLQAGERNTAKEKGYGGEGRGGGGYGGRIDTTTLPPSRDEVKGTVPVPVPDGNSILFGSEKYKRLKEQIEKGLTPIPKVDEQQQDLSQ